MAIIKPFRLYRKNENGGESAWISSYETRKEAEYARDKANDPYGCGENNGYFVIQIH